LNRAEALKALADPSATTRLRAARVLSEQGKPDDLAPLRSARAVEADSWTQRALDRAIYRLSTGVRVPPPSPGSVEGQDGVLAVQSQALQIATKRVLHEVRPVLQSINRSARADIGSHYEATSTHAAVSRMSDLLEALQSLGEAAQSPKQTQFDLSELVAARVKLEGLAESVVLARSDPMLVNGDPALVALAFVNLARNAVEATSAALSETKVVINWGRNDSVAWIAVLDEGDGLPPDALSAALEIGTTTRTADGHFGLGLPIALQAMQSLGGEIVLQPRRDGGTAAEARWPQ
jgi:signal transduction histidine kinase